MLNLIQRGVDRVPLNPLQFNFQQDVLLLEPDFVRQ